MPCPLPFLALPCLAPALSPAFGARLGSVCCPSAVPDSPRVAPSPSCTRAVWVGAIAKPWPLSVAEATRLWGLHQFMPRFWPILQSLCPGAGVPLVGGGSLSNVSPAPSNPLPFPTSPTCWRGAGGWLGSQQVGASHSLRMQPPRYPHVQPSRAPPPPGTEQPPPQPSHLPEGLLQLEVEHTLLHHRLLHLPATSILPCCSSTTVPRLAPQIRGGPVPATHPCPTAALPSHRVVSSQHVTCGRVLLFPTLNPTRASASCVCELTIKGSWRHNPGRAGRTPTLTHDAGYRTPAASPDAGQPRRRQPPAVPQFPHL